MKSRIGTLATQIPIIAILALVGAINSTSVAITPAEYGEIAQALDSLTAIMSVEEALEAFAEANTSQPERIEAARQIALYKQQQPRIDFRKQQDRLVLEDTLRSMAAKIGIERTLEAFEGEYPPDQFQEVLLVAREIGLTEQPRLPDPRNPHDRNILQEELRVAVKNLGMGAFGAFEDLYMDSPEKLEAAREIIRAIALEQQDTPEPHIAQFVQEQRAMPLQEEVNQEFFELLMQYNQEVDTALREFEKRHAGNNEHILIAREIAELFR